MATYKTPGVYVEEVSTLPASIAPVATAVPAFIGYTEKAVKRGKDLTNMPTRVTSLVEFKEWFGGPAPVDSIEVDLDSENRVDSAELTPVYHLYNSVQLYYDNGGGNCYIVSIGNYEDDIDGTINSVSGKARFTNGLDALRKYDEPTLLLFPDAIQLSGTSLYDVQVQSLKQCAELQDRFTVMDLKELYDDGGELIRDWQTGIDEFRNNVGINNLKYGAAYTPHLEANLDKSIKWRYITLTQEGSPVSSLANLTASQEIRDLVTELEDSMADYDNVTNLITTLSGSSSSLGERWAALVTAYNDAGTGTEVAAYTALADFIVDIAEAIEGLNEYGGSATPTGASGFPLDVNNAIFKGGVIGGKLQEQLEDLAEQALAETATLTWTTATLDPSTTGNDWEIDVVSAGTPASDLDEAVDDLFVIFKVFEGCVLELLAAAATYEKTAESTLYEIFGVFRNVWDAASDAIMEVPPSGAICGVYSAVDRTRGVWKAPANVSLNSIADLTVSIDANEQEDLNVDTIAGKSINAIRAFTGKGILVWGARTLAGNDNEWRYVPVRRFYNFAEESIKKATEFVVFEPNDANTWSRVRSMISNFLTNQWRAGALAGKTPEEAFFVNIGLGETMTSTDILEGRMIVEIGMAVVRPAEFIILRFSHKLQES